MIRRSARSRIREITDLLMSFRVDMFRHANDFNKINELYEKMLVEVRRICIEAHNAKTPKWRRK